MIDLVLPQNCIRLHIYLRITLPDKYTDILFNILYHWVIKLYQDLNCDHCILLIIF